MASFLVFEDFYQFKGSLHEIVLTRLREILLPFQVAKVTSVKDVERFLLTNTTKINT